MDQASLLLNKQLKGGCLLIHDGHLLVLCYLLNVLVLSMSRCREGGMRVMHVS